MRYLMELLRDIAPLVVVMVWHEIDEEKKWQKRKREMYEDFKAWLEMEGRI